MATALNIRPEAFAFEAEFDAYEGGAAAAGEARHLTWWAAPACRSAMFNMPYAPRPI